MNCIESLFKNGVMEMATYSPIEPPDQIALRLGIPESEIIKLDANENPYGVAPEVLEELGRAKYLSIYPDPAQKAIRQEIARYAGCNANNIVAGAGADELIDLICRLVLNPGDKVLTFTPTFSYYKHVVELNGGVLVDVHRNEDYSIATDTLSEIDLDGIKVVLLCSPNNPPGNMLEEEVLNYFLAKDMLVVVDEAYYEFSGSTYADRIDKHKNLLVLRTFSKCFGLAGLRVGYGIMSPVVQEAIMKIKPPYSVNMAAEVALRVCLKKKEIFASLVERMIATRDRVIAELSNCEELQVYPSHSNFILFRLKSRDAKALKDAMENKGILLRYFNTPQLQNHLRVSVGTEEQMDVFLREFFALLQ
ncbi:MAG: histidinol-phosphate aminotransferase [Desulforhopalus sp.]|jgi:histidinol-phosphate aminotransferase